MSTASSPQKHPPAHDAAGNPAAFDLPTLEGHPDADVVIFDGHCNFCIAQVNRLARWASPGQLAFVSLHDPAVQKRFPDLSHDQLMEQLYLIDGQGNRHAGAAAFRYLSRRCPKLWILAPLLHIPFSLRIWQWLYKQIARRRYKLAVQRGQACSDSGCHVHLENPKR
jgi:predicted DCC family thiol-disulfide oxidoreductase YuxK